MTRYLLLGANGFLGRQVRSAIQATDRGAHLTAVSGHESLPPTSPNCHWHRVDLVRATRQDLALLLDYSKPDVVINCAGRTLGSVDELEAVNVSVVRKLVEVLGQGDPVPLIHLGSAAEYGRQPLGMAVAEWAVARPSDDYGRTKLAATDLITEKAGAGEILATVLRVFDPVGPGSPGHSPAGSALSEIRRALAVHASFVTLGELSSCRDFLATTDVAEAVLRAAKAGDAPHILNVGRGVAMSGRSMVELLAATAEFDGDIFESTATDSPFRSPVLWQQADLTLLRRHLRWVPTTSIAEAVHDLWQSGS
jgi:NDP-hexose 4-ketoreductase